MNKISDMIDFCYEHDGDLNDWEITFLDSIDAQLKRTGGLSIKQEEKLKQIYSNLSGEEEDNA